MGNDTSEISDFFLLQIKHYEFFIITLQQEEALYNTDEKLISRTGKRSKSTQKVLTVKWETGDLLYQSTHR